jgi:hypothetical protein
MINQETVDKINSEFDFINLKRYEYSMKKLLNKHESGVSDSMISTALCIPEKKVLELYESAVANLRKIMKVE